MMLVRRLPDAGVRYQGCRRRRLRRVGGPARHERGVQERLDRARRQAVLRPVLLLPMGRALPPEPVRREGLRDPGDVGRVQGAVRPDGRRWHHPAGGRQRRRVAADGHVRHAQPARQRLRLPHLADGWQGELDRRTGDRRLHALERDHRLLPARLSPDARGRTPPPRSATRKSGCTCSGRSSPPTSTPIRSRTSSTTSRSSRSPRSTPSTARTRSRHRSTGS